MARRKIFYKGMLLEWALITLLSFLFYDVVWLVADDKPALESIKEDGFYLLADLLYCALFSFLILLVSRLIARIGYFEKLTYKRQLLLCLSTLVCNIAIAGLVERLYDWLLPQPYDNFEVGLCIVGFLAMVSSLAHNVQYYSKMVVEQNAQNIQMEKKMMKMHLDPHFVFNNLNILAGLVRTNPGRAEAFIIRLSKVYRHIISTIDKDVTTLCDAIDFALNYVEVLDVRFPGKIKLQVEPELKAVRNVGVLSSSLHLLIENAVKHNMPDGASVLTISVCRDGDRLLVCNNILADGHAGSIPSLGIGLKNLQERYRLQCGRLPEIHQTATSYEVLLPLLSLEE